MSGLAGWAEWVGWVVDGGGVGWTEWVGDAKRGVKTPATATAAQW